MLRRQYRLLFAISLLGLSGCKHSVESSPTNNDSVNAALRTVVYQLFCSGDTAKMKRDISAVLGCSGSPDITLVFTNNFIMPPQWQRGQARGRSRNVYRVAQYWYTHESADTTGLWQRLQNIQPLPVAVDTGSRMCVCDALIRVAFAHTSFKKPGGEEQPGRWPGPTLFITVSQPILLDKPGIVAYYYELAGEEDRLANSGHFFIVDTKQQPQRVLASDMIFIH